MSKATMPRWGERYEDVAGRILEVREVRPGDPLGREVCGFVRRGGVSAAPYSCTLLTWADIWRDRAPRVPIAGMKVGG